MDLNDFMTGEDGPPTTLTRSRACPIRQKSCLWSPSRRATRWTARRPAITEAIARAIQAHVPLSPDTSVLDFGCGTAALSVLLAGKVGRITAADSSSGMIAEAQRKVTAVPELAAVIQPVHLPDGDAGRLRECWDVVCTAMALHHIEDAEQALRHLARCVTPGGYIAVADLYSEDGSFHGQEPVPHNGFDPEGLAEVLRAEGLDAITVQTVLTFARPSPLQSRGSVLLWCA